MQMLIMWMLILIIDIFLINQIIDMLLEIQLFGDDMKKRIIIILLIVLDIVMVILNLNLGNNYIKNKNKLTEILKDREYDDLKKNT